MSLHGTYDSQNIFALIIRGDLPCYKLYEDDDVLAFLDLFPQSRGHSLVIPKRAAARNILEIDDASLAKVMAVVVMAIATLRLWPWSWPRVDHGHSHGSVMAI